MARTDFFTALRGVPAGPARKGGIAAQRGAGTRIAERVSKVQLWE
jgi:hypothetical protein